MKINTAIPVVAPAAGILFGGYMGSFTGIIMIVNTSGYSPNILTVEGSKPCFVHSTSLIPCILSQCEGLGIAIGGSNISTN